MSNKKTRKPQNFGGELGKRIRTGMTTENCGMSLLALSQALKLPYHTVFDVANGHTNASLSTIGKIYDFLGFELDFPKATSS